MKNAIEYNGTKQDVCAGKSTVVVNNKNILLELNAEHQESPKAFVNKNSIKIGFDTIPLTELPSFSSGLALGLALSN